MSGVRRASFHARGAAGAGRHQRKLRQAWESCTRQSFPACCLPPGPPARGPTRRSDINEEGFSEGRPLSANQGVSFGALCGGGGDSVPCSSTGRGAEFPGTAGVGPKTGPVPQKQRWPYESDSPVVLSVVVPLWGRGRCRSGRPRVLTVLLEHGPGSGRSPGVHRQLVPRPRSSATGNRPVACYLPGRARPRHRRAS